ncbi:LacI family DNA-binding transcriptional regulator [Agreia pratensis]|uniref:LacI family DNA-binding transcriptional regulator n=1 Tax=Agreia pratensis TaxID=150121 RepID=UPI00188A3D30|nr:LacI family DNA-binding transcriptional regulator [Agreia pratensis]MBF4636165.1 LacI family DNA-binding transcriptional regulator [Agreia pratensis]
MGAESAAARAPRRRVTLAQVAERAGVSRSAVSFVLTGRTDQRLSVETTERVRKAAEELGYRPNMTARTLRTGRSGTVALVSDFVSSTSHANSMVRGALDALRERDTILFTVDTQGDAGQEKQVIDSLLDRTIDGVLYASMFTRAVTPPALLSQVPFVLLNCVPAVGVARAVIPDEVAAGRDAANELLQFGHRDHIWFVGSLPPGVTGGLSWRGWAPLALFERLEGIRQALADVGAELAGTQMVDDDWTTEDGREAVTRLLATGAHPSALICANDAVAAGAYQALHRAELRVPEDVSVVAFDGSPISRAIDPPLTSIALPQVELGRRAVELLFDKEAQPVIHRIAMTMVRGGSVGPAR